MGKSLRESQKNPLYSDVIEAARVKAQRDYDAATHRKNLQDGEGMKPLTEADVSWLESRIPTYRWTDEDRRRIIADLRAARECLGVALMHNGDWSLAEEDAMRAIIYPREILAELKRRTECS